MEYDRDKVDELMLALLFLGMSKQGAGGRAWKGPNLEVLNRLHQKGWIGDPMGKAPSVDVTPAGWQRAEELFRIHFGRT